MNPSPYEAWQGAVDRGRFVDDPAQRMAAEALQACYTQLHEKRRKKIIAGVYLWGPVGRGKTWLMDRFYESLQVPARRQHFHHFMQWVHQRLFQLTGTANPLRALARELAMDVQVLCFDELFVSDIGDALILGGLLQVMFVEGVTVVATSNQPPAELYAGGHNRERFLPAISAIEQHMKVQAVDGGQDHRQHPGQEQLRYWIDAQGNGTALASVFEQLKGRDDAREGPITLGHRQIATVRYSADVLWCRYADLCEQPLSALDFIGICDRFKTILLDGVPCLSAPRREGRIARGTEDASEQVKAGDRQLPQLSIHDDGVRRFIALVDECYDRQVPLYIQARVAMNELYTEGYLEFAFRRTLSRLQEMQLQRYGS